VDATAPRVTSLQVLSRGHQEATLLVTATEPVTVSLSYGRDEANTKTLEGAAKASTTHRLRVAELLPSAKYTVLVTARDEAGNAQTARNVFSTLDDLVAPTRVPDAVLRDAGDGRLALTWSPASDDVGLAGYRIFRERDGAFVAIATVQGLDFEDTGLLLETPYAYRVAAVDLAGNLGEPSPTVTGVSSAVPVLLDGTVTPEEGMKTDTYRYRVVYRNGGGAAPLEVRVIINGVPFLMAPEKASPTAEDYRQGVVYVYETALAPHTLGKPHTYRFDASDGRYRILFGPDTGFKGPRVSDLVSPAEDDGAFGLGGFVRGIPGFDTVLVALFLCLFLVAPALRRRRQS
ncbi:MAG TPA: fibronectin type III domain-containing protein, partial [Candidatus Thermoplasmatota archaeon]|nr:fibronectin type III domain-containing protein [Candidatus Thermoplasmatota archaeon]